MSRDKSPEVRAEEPNVRAAVSARRARRSYFLCALALCLIFATACRQDMQDQPRYEAYEASKFFKDGLSSRPLVEGTVPRGYLRDDAHLYTGKKTTQGTSAAAARSSSSNSTAVSGNAQAGGSASAQTAGGATSSNTEGGGGAGTAAAAPTYPDDVDTFPFPVTEEVVARGQERYQIFCSVCHGATGSGDGMVVRRGFRRPPSFHTDALRGAPVGHFFDVITNGWGAMPRYSQQIPAQDRWAIISYIRALQLSHPATDENANAPSGATQTSGGGGQR